VTDKKYGHDVPLLSGYNVFVTPLPPYYKELVEQRFPLPDYPVRKIELAAGDLVDWPYEPPKKLVKVDDDDYDLYIQWHIADKNRQEIQRLRNIARIDYLLSMCVAVTDGEYLVEDTEWADKLEAAFTDFQVPAHKGKRYLLFLKHIVITTTEEMDVVISLCTSPEVTMQGIINALQGFQDSVEA